MKSKKMLRNFLALAIVGIMIFAACGRGGNNAGGAAGGEIHRDGTLVFGGQGWGGLFNPIMNTNIYDAYVNGLVFQGLISNDMQGIPIGILATHWTVSDDGLTYTFHIDPRATFSNGRPLTAHDVSFTFHTIAHPYYDGPRTDAVEDLVGFQEFRDGYVDHVAGIRVIDNHTIAFDHVLASPVHIWNFSYGILCSEYYAFNTWEEFMLLIDRPFGSGPFVFVDYVFQQWIEFTRNENFWNPDKQPNLAGIVMRDIPQESLVPELLAGNIHVAMPAANMDNLTAIQDADNLWYNLFVANTLRHITFNTLRPHLSDHRVRQALAYAFDTEQYIFADTGSFDLRAVGNSPFSPVSWAFPGVDALNNYEFNMERAHQLMDEAGWLMQPNGFRYKDGERFHIHWLIYPEAAWPGIITGMASHTWRELGVDLTIDMFDFTTVQAMASQPAVGEGQFDIFQMGWIMGIDPDLRGGLWDATQTQEGGFFSSGFTHPRLMELIALGAATMEIEDRIPIYHEIAEITNYYLPVWVLSNGTMLWTFSNRVNNIEVGPFFNWIGAITQQGTWLSAE